MLKFFANSVSIFALVFFANSAYAGKPITKFSINGIETSVFAETVLDEAAEEDCGDGDKICGPLQFIFGRQTYDLSEQKLNQLGGRCSSFAGISVEQPDFDGDLVPDAVARIYCNRHGSSQTDLYFIISSSKQKAWLYVQSGGGNGFWAGRSTPLPTISGHYTIFEELDYMPQYLADNRGDDDDYSHPDEIGFIFTRQWDGNGFSHKPVPGFYKALLPDIRKAIISLKPGRVWLKKMYGNIFADFERAAAGRKISNAAMKSSQWRVLKEFEQER